MALAAALPHLSSSSSASSTPSSSTTRLPSSMIQTQTASVLHGAKDLRTEQRTIWNPRAGEVQVRILAVGLCGSDLHYYTHGRNGDFKVQAPLVLGHEAVGVITALGPPAPPNNALPKVYYERHGGDPLYVGQRVVLEPGYYCGTCSHCSRGRYNLCKQMRFCSSAKTFPHMDGMLVEKINHPRGLVWPIPETLPTPVAALAEPLSVLLHAASRGRLISSFSEAFAPLLAESQSSVQPSSKSSSTPQSLLQQDKAVLVFGVGTIGMLAAALARFLGARKVCAVDIDPTRLALAKAQGWVDDTFVLERAPAPPSAAEGLTMAREAIEPALKQFGEEGFDVVFECTGVEKCVQMGVFASLPGSTLLLVGMGTPAITLPVSAAALREVDVIGCFRYAGTWAEAVRILDLSAQGNGQGLGDIEKLLTHRVTSLDDASRAFELLAKGRDEQGGLVLKVLVGAGSED